MTATLQGRTIGPWELVERIGGGGQAAVYRVRHSALGRPAALKLVHREIWADPSFRVRFRRECEALLALRHPHIVPIHDAGEQDGRGFLVMALARGGSLAGRLAGGPLDPVEASALLGPVADALDAAHAAGLVHRDVTPANVLLDPAGPWLADFGIARRLDATAMTAEGLLVGTAGFLAPEVIEGRPAGPASDRYALAAVAFEALDGAAALPRPTAPRGSSSPTSTAPPRGPRRCVPACRRASTRPSGAASRRTPASGPRRPARWSTPSGPGARGPAGARAAPRGRSRWRPSRPSRPPAPRRGWR